MTYWALPAKRGEQGTPHATPRQDEQDARFAAGATGRLYWALPAKRDEQGIFEDEASAEELLLEPAVEARRAVAAATRAEAAAMRAAADKVAETAKAVAATGGDKEDGYVGPGGRPQPA